MTSRNRTQRCLDCGASVSIWAMHCPACIERRREEAKAARRLVFSAPPAHYCECGAVVVGKGAYCRTCARQRHADLQRERRNNIKYAWWYYGPPVGGFAISEPGW